MNRYKLAFPVLAGLVAFGVLTVAHRFEPDASKHPASGAKRSTPELPQAQPGYARDLQGVLDAARPKGQPRVVVRDCRAGRVGNEHFCAWLYGGKCRAGFITEDPAQGTVPHDVGRAPLPPGRCTTAEVFAWLRTQPREGARS